MSRQVNVIEEVKATNNENKVMSFDEGGRFFKQPAFNPFMIDHGKTRYKVDNVIFYNNNGIVFETNNGWFGFGNNNHEGLDFTEEVKLKRKEKYDGTVFIMSNKDQRFSIVGGKSCTLYIPIEYLESMGYTIEEITSTNNERHETRVERILKTDKFSFTLNIQEYSDFEAQRDDLIQALEKCDTKDELQEELRKRYWITRF